MVPDVTTSVSAAMAALSDPTALFPLIHDEPAGRSETPYADLHSLPSFLARQSEQIDLPLPRVRSKGYVVADDDELEFRHEITRSSFP